MKISRMHRLDDSANYVRDTHGTWRYRISGEPVPDARDAGTVGSAQFAFEAHRVLLPAYLAANDASLEWARVYPTTSDRHGLVCHAVPLAAWQAHGDVRLTLWAPELSTDRVLAGDDAAAHARVTIDTLLELWREGRGPAPAYEIDDVYYWAVPPLNDWFHWARRSSQDG